MKKIFITLILVTSSIFALNVKNNTYFMSFGIGANNIFKTQKIYNVKFGYYFYDPNIYFINNRIYADINYVDDESTDAFLIGNLKLDWIKNFSVISPYAGINVGYIYYKKNNTSKNSTGIWGVDGGLIFNVNKNVSIDLSGCWQKAMQKKDFWTRNIRTVKVGLEFSF